MQISHFVQTVFQGRIGKLIDILRKTKSKKYQIPVMLMFHSLSSTIMKDCGTGFIVDGRRAAVNALPIECDELALHFLRTSSRMETLQDVKLDLENLKREWNTTDELVNIGVLRKTNSGLQYPPTKNQLEFIKNITTFNLPESYKPAGHGRIGLEKIDKMVVDVGKSKKKGTEWVYKDNIARLGCAIGKMGDDTVVKL